MNNQVELKQYQYEIDVGHSKSGSNHVVVLKSLKVRSDDLTTALQEIYAALRSFNDSVEAFHK